MKLKKLKPLSAKDLTEGHVYILFGFHETKQEKKWLLASRYVHFRNENGATLSETDKTTNIHSVHLNDIGCPPNKSYKESNVRTLEHSKKTYEFLINLMHARDQESARKEWQQFLKKTR